VNKASAELESIFTLILVLLALLTVISVALLPSRSSTWVKWAQSIGVALSVGLVLSLVFYVASDRFIRSAEQEQIHRVEEALARE
jgi:glucan phosphoethanolaminetransferase (alkaline phosphatase superfamily)